MVDFLPYNAASHPIVKLSDDWNNLLDHGLEKEVSYIVRKNGSYYEAIRGGTATGAGKIVFGGVGNVGSVNGSLFASVLQACIDNLTAAGGVIKLRAGTFTLAAQVNLKSNVGVVGEGVTCTIISYTGAAKAFSTAAVDTQINGAEVGNFTLQNDGTGTYAFDLDYLAGCSFHNLKITKDWTYGFHNGEHTTYGSAYNNYKQIVIQRTTVGGTYGVYLESTGAGIFEYNCTFENVMVINYTTSWKIHAERGTFTSVGAYGGTDGFILDGRAANTFVSAQLEELTRGFTLQGNTWGTTILSAHFFNVTTPYTNTSDFWLVHTDYNGTGDFWLNKELNLNNYVLMWNVAHPTTTTWGATEKGRHWFCTTHGKLEFWDGAAIRSPHDPSEELIMNSYIRTQVVNDPSTVGWGNPEKGRLWWCGTHGMYEYWNGSYLDQIPTTHKELEMNHYFKWFKTNHPNTGTWGAPETGRMWYCTTHSKVEVWTGAAVETVSSA